MKVVDRMDKCIDAYIDKMFPEPAEKGKKQVNMIYDW